MSINLFQYSFIHYTYAIYLHCILLFEWSSPAIDFPVQSFFNLSAAQLMDAGHITSSLRHLLEDLDGGCSSSDIAIDVDDLLSLTSTIFNFLFQVVMI